MYEINFVDLSDIYNKQQSECHVKQMLYEIFKDRN
jgi:aryl-alcohol dehydrogenase-like predicted oxidoreductase